METTVLSVALARFQVVGMTALEFFPAFVEVKLAGSAGEIEGYGSTFGNLDLTGDIVAPGAFAKSLVEHRAAKSMPAMLWSHNPDEPIGIWTDGKEDQRGLKLKGKLTLDTRRGAEARALASDGALALSIGYRTRDASYEKGHRVLKDVQLLEVSLVAIPANPQARLTSVKTALAAGELTPVVIERALRDLGVPKKFARRLVAGGWDAANTDPESVLDEKAIAEMVRGLDARTAELSRFTKGS